MRGRMEREVFEGSRRDVEREAVSRGRAGGGDDDERRSPERESADVQGRGPDARWSLWSRDQSFQLRRSELEAMSEIGRFRMIDVEDLVQFVYDRDGSQAEQDLRNLITHSLVRQVRILSRSGIRYRVVVLTSQEPPGGTPADSGPVREPEALLRVRQAGRGAS
jgi:hypothetical protein